MYLFIYEGFNKNTPTEALVERALQAYLWETGIEVSADWDLKMMRTKSGKPVFRNAPIHFSVSHTGAMWVCLMGTENAGVDIQEEREINFEELAGRFFTDEEEKYVKLWGVTGFLQIWVRKEAIIKYMGITLAEGLTNYNTVEYGEILDKINITGGELLLKEIEISDEIQCACAMKEDEEIWIRTLN